MIGAHIFWLVPIFPLVVFVLLVVGLARYGRLASGLAAVAMAVAFLVAVLGLLAAAVVKAILTLSRRCSVIDRRVFDAFAARLAKATLALVRVSGRMDRRGFDASARIFGQEVLAISQRLRSWQTGRIENYLLAVFIWGLGVVVIAVFVMLVR